MAGVAVEAIQKKLGVQRIIRSMPNLSTKVGEGVTGWISSVDCSDRDKKDAEIIFSACGHQFELEQESQLDALVAISGSGPAYFFYLTQLLKEKAEEFGFTSQQATRLARHTFVGAAQSFMKSDMTSEEWVSAVKSKGGTTEAALESMNDNSFGDIFKKAVNAAKNRSEEVGCVG